MHFDRDISPRQPNWLDNLLRPHDDFFKEAEKYDRWDVLFGLILAIVSKIILSIMAAPSMYDVMVETELDIFVAYSIALFVPTILISSVLLISKVRGRKIVRNGMRKDMVVKSILVGIILAMFHLFILRLGIFSVANITLRENLSFVSIAISVVHLLIFTAFMERLFNGAYIGLAFFNTFKSKGFSIVVAGAVFSAMHVPARMFAHDTSYLTTLLTPMFGDILIHGLFFWLYAKYNNIFGPVLYHFIINFAWWLLVW